MRSVPVYFFLVCLSVVTKAQVNLSDRLVACYSFTGNANDSSGNNHHGAVAGAELTADRFGRLNHAYSFNGASSINLPFEVFSSHLNFSWSLWVLVAQNPGDEEAQAIISIGETGYRSSHFNQTVLNDYSSYELTGFGTGGGVQGGGLAPIQTGALPNVGVWYHLVTTRDDTDVKFYVNGTLFASVPDNGLAAIFYQDVLAVAKLGLRSDGTQGLVGKIDDVSIYSRAINGDEVMALYTSGIPCTPPAHTVLEKDVVACYSFTGNASDSSGNNYHGTVIGAQLTADRFGNANHAYLFNGTSSISLPPEVFTLYRNFSYSSWVRVDQNPSVGEAQTVISVGQTDYRSSHFNQTVLNNYSSLELTGFGTGGGVQGGGLAPIQTGSLPTIGVWYHLVTTRDDNEVKFYINGTFFASVPDNSLLAVDFHDPLAVANLGLRSDGNQGLIGSIDDVTIYGRAIDATEVLKLYQKGSPCITPSKPILEKDIVACYSFSGNAIDSSGNNYNATVAGAQLAADRFGNAKSAYFFDGFSSIDLPPEVFTTYKNFSYSLWVSLTQNPFDGDAGTILSVGQTGYRSAHFNQTVLNDYPSGSFTFNGFGTGGGVQGGSLQQIQTGSLPVIGSWYHLVTTRDESAVKFYINGTLFTAVPDNGLAAIDYHDPLAVAKLGLRSDGNQGLIGSIDDVTIYGRAIDAEEVLKLYKKGSPCITQVKPTVDKDIVACYPFTGNANDNSGNHHDAAVVGAQLAMDRFGKANQAYSFSGTNAISVPPSVFTPYRNFSYSLWVSPTQNPDYGNAESIISVGQTSDRSPHFNQTILNHYPSGDFIFTGFGTGGGVQGGSISQITSGSLPATNAWYHLVTTRDDVAVKFYVDGQLVESIPDNHAPPIYYNDPLAVANIGLRSDGNQGFVGLIDDVTIYGRAITEEEVNMLYVHGSPCPTEPTPTLEFFVPNIIIANADTLNRILSVFTIDSLGAYKAYSRELPFYLIVMNRWGKELFRSYDPVTGWDGSGVDAGIYFYVITISDRKIKGTVSVFR